jgi:DNA-binding LacI/PurR family transcriptional regulator
VPQDVSLIAIHKLPAEDYRTPAMTCVEMPLRELGKRAVELLLDTPWDTPIQETMQQAIHVSHGATVAPPLAGSPSAESRSHEDRSYIREQLAR